ncbi:MAG: cupin domain-containing protein [Terriglobales bacterium]
MKNFYDIRDLVGERAQLDKRYLEFLRVPAMSAGVYELKVGEEDPQSPHQEDELYYVVSGRARMKVGGEAQPVSTGIIIFVAAKAEHRFYDIEEDLTVLVFFAPAETS